MAEPIRIARSAFAKRSSGFGRPISANTLPLLSTTSILLGISHRPLLPCHPSPVFFFGSPEARMNQVQFSFRRLDARFRFLLEYMQDVHAASESNGIDGP